MRLLAIDPGNTQSAYVAIDPDTCRPLTFGKVPNDELLDIVTPFDGPVFVEMIASYGMPVGREVFETCVFVGRVMATHALLAGGQYVVELVYRQPVKLHHCHSSKAKDANVTQALVDRFAPGQPNHGKGTKNSPGWFYGFRADIWQAYALAVYAADMQMVRTLAVAL